MSPFHLDLTLEFLTESIFAGNLSLGQLEYTSSVSSTECEGDCFLKAVVLGAVLITCGLNDSVAFSSSGENRCELLAFADNLLREWLVVPLLQQDIDTGEEAVRA